MIRCLALAALFVAAAAPVWAQSAGQAAPVGETRSLAPSSSPTAAATLPNTFDGPARPVAAPAASAPAAAAPASAAQSGVTDADMAEGALRVVIADLAEGRLDAELFTVDLANRLRPQLPTLRPIVQGFGALGAIEPQGLNNGASQFLVTFENAATQWVLGLNAEGRVSALLFRPAPAESSEPGAETPPTAEAAAPETSAPDER